MVNGMDKLNHNGSIYDIIGTIEFNDTTHLIIKRDNDIQYINKTKDKYYIPPINLSLEANKNKDLVYIRKQYLLRYFVDYLKQHNIYDIDTINKLIKAFEMFINRENIQGFMYWPLLNDTEFNDELNEIFGYLDIALTDSLNPSIKQTIDYDVIKASGFRR